MALFFTARMDSCSFSLLILGVYDSHPRLARYVQKVTWLVSSLSTDRWQLYHSIAIMYQAIFWVVSSDSWVESGNKERVGGVMWRVHLVSYTVIPCGCAGGGRIGGCHSGNDLWHHVYTPSSTPLRSTPHTNSCLSPRCTWWVTRCEEKMLLVITY